MLACPNPATRIPNPETQNLEAETSIPKPETSNPKPQTRNPKLETRSQKPETRIPKRLSLKTGEYALDMALPRERMIFAELLTLAMNGKGKFMLYPEPVLTFTDASEKK